MIFLGWKMKLFKASVAAALLMCGMANAASSGSISLDIAQHGGYREPAQAQRDRFSPEMENLISDYKKTGDLCGTGTQLQQEDACRRMPAIIQSLKHAGM